jgi:ATP sulfurylase
MAKSSTKGKYNNIHYIEESIKKYMQSGIQPTNVVTTKEIITMLKSHMFFKPRIFQKLLLLRGWSWFQETDAWRRDVVYPN